MGKDFAGTNDCDKAIFDNMRATDIKEEPYTPTKNHNTQDENVDITIPPMVTKRPKILDGYIPGQVGSPGLEANKTICITERNNAQLRMHILDYVIGRRRLDLTYTIREIISTCLEELEEDIVTVTDQVNHQHIVAATIERMLAKTLIPLCPDLDVAMWESMPMRVDL